MNMTYSNENQHKMKPNAKLHSKKQVSKC